MNKWLLHSSVYVFLAMSCGVPLLAEEATTATINTIVLDDAGVYAFGAHVYVYASDRDTFYGVYPTSGTASIPAPAGRYRVYAARTTNDTGVFDHYVSPVAHITLIPGEITSVILSLQLAHDPEMVVSDAVLEKIAITPELAKYLN